MSHAPAIDLGHDQPPLPNEHFSSWLRGQTTLFISQIVAILGSISLVASTIYYVRHMGGENEPHDLKHTLLNVKLIVDYLHLVFIAVFILVMIRFLDENDRGSYRVGRVYERVFKGRKPGEQEIGDLLDNGKTQLRTFKTRFLWFWIGMLCLYVSFAGQHTYEATSASRHDDGQRAEASAKFSGSVASDVPGAARQKFKGEMTFSPAEERKAPDEPSSGDATMKLVFSFVDFFFNNVTLLSVYWCFLVMSIRPGEEGKAKERKYKRRSLALVGGLIVLFPLYPLYLWLNGDAFVWLNGNVLAPTSAGAYSSIFDALSGVVNAVALALLIARLDSKLVGLPSWLISILYSYAAVQPLFLVFELSTSPLLNIIATLVLIFVFIFKIYFFLIIFYALQTGKMLNYLACFPVLRTRAAEPWEDTIDDRPFLTRLKEFRLFSLKGLWRFALSSFKWLWRFALDTFKRLWKFALSAFRNVTKRSATHRGRRARAYVRLTRIRISRARKRAERAASRLLSSRRCVKVAEVLGGIAVFHFFVSMIASQVLPEPDAWGGGLQGDALFLLSGVLRPQYPAPVIVGVIQVLAAAAMIAILNLVSEYNDNGRDGAVATAQKILDEPLDYAESIELGKEQLKKFKKYFRYFWWVTLVLYVVFLIDPEMYKPITPKMPEPNTPKIYKPITPEIHNPKVINVGAQVGDVSGAGGAPETRDASETNNPQAEGAGVNLFGLLPFPAVECCLASLNLMFIFWCFVVLRSPPPPRPPEVTCKRPEVTDKLFAERLKRSGARQKLLINYSLFIIFLLIAVYPLIFAKMSGLPQDDAYPRDYATVFDGVTGMLSAIVLALLIARMDSKLFNLPSSLIWMLFAYASIQTLFIAFVQIAPVLQMVKGSVLIAALGLKICLFLSVAHSMQSGSVLRYLVCLPFLKERVDSIFENQFEIKLARIEEKEFTFSILKKNRLHYSTTQIFESRKECDDAIKVLQERMKEIESYKESNASGTYWVEVWSPKEKKELLCESIPLRSSEEAHDLIDESMSKVPYCKYNRL